MPGSPPTSTTEPGTSPPPSTRSNSPMLVVSRDSSETVTSLSAVIAGGSILPAQPLRRLCATPAFSGSAASIAISLSVFQRPQSVHCPCHLLCSEPHSAQTYAVLRRALDLPDFPIIEPLR